MGSHPDRNALFWREARPPEIVPRSGLGSLRKTDRVGRDGSTDVNKHEKSVRNAWPLFKHAELKRRDGF